MSYDCSDANKINFSEIQEFAQRKLGEQNEETLKRIDIAFQSINKRQRYCLYHYDLFKESTTPIALLKDRFEQPSEEELSIRDAYEANCLAFLHNLHAMMDSFPFTLNLIYQQIKDVDSRNVGWNKDFIKAYKSFDFYKCMKAFSKREHFLLIKEYSNHEKHRYPIRIKNTFTELVFEEFKFYNTNIEEKNVEEVMTNCHDKLMPEFFKLINAAL